MRGDAGAVRRHMATVLRTSGLLAGSAGAVLGIIALTNLWNPAGWVAAAIFLVMGFLLIRKPAAPLNADSRLTRPGIWAGLSVGVAAVIGNPKAILFYMGALPGFFTLERLTRPDIAAIIAVSALVPMAGNLGLALFLDRARRLLSSPAAMHRMNTGSGILLICVGLVIPFL